MAAGLSSRLVRCMDLAPQGPNPYIYIYLSDFDRVRDFDYFLAASATQKCKTKAVIRRIPAITIPAQENKLIICFLQICLKLAWSGSVFLNVFTMASPISSIPPYSFLAAPHLQFLFRFLSVAISFGVNHYARTKDNMAQHVHPTGVAATSLFSKQSTIIVWQANLIREC